MLCMYENSVEFTCGIHDQCSAVFIAIAKGQGG